MKARDFNNAIEVTISRMLKDNAFVGDFDTTRWRKSRRRPCEIAPTIAGYPWQGNTVDGERRNQGIIEKKYLRNKGEEIKNSCFMLGVTFDSIERVYSNHHN